MSWSDFFDAIAGDPALDLFDAIPGDPALDLKGDPALDLAGDPALDLKGDPAFDLKAEPASLFAPILIVLSSSSLIVSIYKFSFDIPGFLFYKPSISAIDWSCYKLPLIS